MRPAPPPLLLAALLLTGCAAASTAVGERQLDVQTRMSDTVFLDPVPARRRTVYIEVRNSSDRPELDIAQAVRAAVAERGYRVVEDANAAHYLLQANVLQAGRSARTAGQEHYRDGFGSVLSGAVIGGATGYAASGSADSTAVVGGALAGATVSTLADAFVQRVDYTVVTDLQISERAGSGLIVTETERSGLPLGSSAQRTQTSSRTSEWKRYRTRVVSTAEQVNLDWPDAAPGLVAGLTRSIAGIF